MNIGLQHQPAAAPDRIGLTATKRRRGGHQFWRCSNLLYTLNPLRSLSENHEVSTMIGSGVSNGNG